MRVRWLTVALWGIAVAALAVGQYQGSHVLVRLGGSALLLAILFGVGHHARVLRQLAGSLSEPRSGAPRSAPASGQTRR